jgi:hypothetical protein
MKACLSKETWKVSAEARDGYGIKQAISSFVISLLIPELSLALIPNHTLEKALLSSITLY